MTLALPFRLAETDAGRRCLHARPRVTAETVQLVAQAQAGDELAFRALYDGHVGRIFLTILRLESDHDLAEELTQETFIHAWRGLPQFKGESAFGTWLFRLAVNRVLTHRRAAGRKRRWLAPSGTPTEEIAARAAPPGTALDLEHAIAGLPEGARAVFILHDVEGFQHQEIAKTLGIAVGTSKAHLFRARRLLREALR